MEKIVLKDKSEIQIINASSDLFQCEVTAAEMASTFDKLTQQNLSRFEIQNADGDVMSIIINKAVTSCEYKDGAATFNLRTVSDTESRLLALEETVDTILMTDLGEE